MRGKRTRLSGSHVLAAHTPYLAVARWCVSPYLDGFHPTSLNDGNRLDPIGWQDRWLVNSGTAAGFRLTIFAGLHFDLIVSSLLVRRVL